jgi:hypothetical protein
MKTKCVRMLAVLACLVMGLSACGSDDGIDDKNGGISSNNSNPDTGPQSDATDAGTSDTSPAEDGSDTPSGPDADDDAGVDADAGGDAGGDVPGDTGADSGAQCPAEPCSAGFVCVEGSCLAETPESKCQAAEELGVLNAGSSIMISDTTHEATDVLSTQCSSGGDERVYEFEVDQDSLVSFESIWPPQFDAKVEFRLGDCADPGDDRSCFDADSSVSVSAGAPVYLVIEQDVGRGNDFQLELSATAESCPAGQQVCSGGVFEKCTGGNSSQAYDCADDCASSSACLGASCNNPLVVSASASFTGDLQAYDTSLDFDGNTSCGYDGNNVPTPGHEIFFKLESLQANQTVTVNTGPNRAMFFTQDCSATPIVCEDVLLSEGTSSSVSWTVPDSGDYNLIIDGRTTTARPFDIGIDITGP